MPVTKVVLVPGMGASWNSDAILNCKLEGYAGDWSLAQYAESTYNSLLAALRDNGWSVLPYYYDWRKQIPTNGTALGNFIAGNTSENEKVNLVGHSMGGLLGRAYLELTAQGSKLSKLFTAGSPHRGATLAYPPWSGGEIWENNLSLRIAMTFVLRRCGGLLNNSRETIQRFVPSVQHLLPIFDYLRDNQTNALKDISTMQARNNWLPTGSFPPFWGITVGTLSGTGFPTLTEIRTRPRNRRDETLGNWTDGKPIGRINTNEGDGTVLLTSSQVLEADNRVLNQSHTGLVASAEGINTILSFLGGVGATSTNQVIEPTSALVIIAYPAHLWTTDPSGKTIKDAAGMVAILNPKSGAYKLKFLPKTFGQSTLIVAQFLDDGKTLWKEYTYRGFFPRFPSLHFNRENPLEDILK